MTTLTSPSMMPYGMQARTSRVWWGEDVPDRRKGPLIQQILALMSPHIAPGADILAVYFDDHEAGQRWQQTTATGAPVASPGFLNIGPRSEKNAILARLAGASLVLDLAGAWVRGTQQTAIQWTEATWNPWVGCSVASAGCNNCYAAFFTGRGMHDSHKAVSRTLPSGRRVWNGKIALNAPKAQYAPVWRSKPTIWFTASLSDIFHEAVPDKWLVELHSVIRHTPHHVYQILTKRPERAAAYYTARPHHLFANTWLGTSIEAGPVMRRIDTLRRIPVPNDQRFLSAEPLIGHLLELDLSGIRWVIAGGESGRHDAIRPVKADWVRDIRDRCLGAEVPFFLKQWGAYLHNPLVTERGFSVAQARIADPPDNAKGGAMLDGRLWRDVPEWRNGETSPCDPKTHPLRTGYRASRGAPTLILAAAAPSSLAENAE
ncbi:DUF5131 family protein [Falsiroseomonas oryziterrae]|uniref:DUF5131 family protein n=1 Tax=Falsiroseomonas oryziterrae TaxID=2911368 RepID=UPI001F2370C6|nr:DUF5131 family protein [Roseomonas sp. NPKOSM-4]